MKIKQIRKIFLPDRTLGEIYIDGKFFCYTLEDTTRSEGVKVKGKTAIPYWTYLAKTTRSNRFGRDMVLIYNTPEKTCSDGLISFSGIRAHGGNKPQDSEGCILVGYNTDHSSIWGTAEKELTEIIKNSKTEVIWEITKI